MSTDVSREVRDLMREFTEVNKEATKSTMRRLKAVIEDSIDEELKNFRQEIVSMIQQSDDAATPTQANAATKEDVDRLDNLESRISSVETRLKIFDQKWRELDARNRKFAVKFMELAETIFEEKRR